MVSLTDWNHVSFVNYIFFKAHKFVLTIHTLTVKIKIIIIYYTTAVIAKQLEGRSEVSKSKKQNVFRYYKYPSLDLKDKSWGAQLEMFSQTQEMNSTNVYKYYLNLFKHTHKQKNS